jgi:hypothetical protein
MKKSLLFTSVTSLSAILMLSSCATMISSRSQSVNVNSNPPAQCSYNNKVSNGSFTTPATITVERSKSSIEIECQAPNYGKSSTEVKPGANFWLLTNILNFGFGYFYDIYSGAGWEYPSDVKVNILNNGGLHTGDFMMRGNESGAIVPKDQFLNTQQNFQQNSAPIPFQQQAPAYQQQWPVAQPQYNGSQVTSPASLQQAPANPLADAMREKEALSKEYNKQ